MINPTDVQERQILFIDPKEGEGKFGMKIQNSNLVLTRDDKPTNKISIHKLLGVFIVGDLTVTSKLIQKTKESGVSLYFLKRNFEAYANISADAEANYLLRQRQYNLSVEEELKLAKFLVKNKLKNQARLLGEQKSGEFKQILQSIDNARDIKELLGIEGNYAKKYFAEFFKDISWRRRAPRTREDIPNLLLDIGYTILFNFIDSLLRLHGFDVYKGFYHQLFFKRKSLVTDIQEPFRCIIDKALLNAYNLGRVKEEDFNFNKRKLEFELPWKNSSKYYEIFADAVMDRKMEIYEFIQAFYRHIMLPDKNKLKEFNINKNYHK